MVLTILAFTLTYFAFYAYEMLDTGTLVLDHAPG